MPLIKVENLSYAYRLGERGFPILNDINFHIASEEIVAIQGPSGSGKSTLLHLLGCMLPCQMGRIQIENQDISHLTADQLALIRNQKIGFVFQQFYLLPKMNVLDNILLPTHYPCELATSSPADKEKALELAQQIGLSHRLHHYPNQLSGGEQQRVAIARALVRGAKIILADEPTGNLDSHMTQQILVLLKSLHEERGVTIVLVTHESQVAQYASRIFYLNDGAIQSTQTIQKNGSTVIPFRRNDSLHEQAQLKQIQNPWHKWITPIRKLAPLAFHNLLRNKIRSFLTMLGITIGIAATLSMVTLGVFTKTKILASYTEMGANTVEIRGYPNFEFKATDFAPAFFESFSIAHDIKPLQTLFPAITALSPAQFIYGPKVSYAGKSLDSDSFLIGIDQDYLNIANRHLVAGHNFYSRNIDRMDAVCIIGNKVAAPLFEHTIPIGKILHITLSEDTTFACQIIGALESVHSTQSMSDENLQILVPYTFFQTITPNPWVKGVYDFFIKLKNTRDIQPVRTGIQNYFQSKYGQSGTFMADANSLLLAQMTKFLNLFTLLLGTIASISLIVAGVGITNMMLASIAERLKEIGIRKAVGATHSSTRLQFLMEAMMIGCMGGILGLLFGFFSYESVLFVASKFVKNLTFEWVFVPSAFALAILFTLSVGLISGIVPALKAEAIDIVTALRSE